MHRIHHIVRNAKYMVAELNLLCKEPHKYDFLLDNPGTHRTQVHMFRHGAKLVRMGDNRWSIHGYASDSKDVRSALAELMAARYMRLAVESLHNVDVLGATPQEFTVHYIGMKGYYPNGQEERR